MKKTQKKTSKNKFPNVKRIKGGLKASSANIAIVVADFNEFFTEKLVDGALDTLCRFGVVQKNIAVVHVPGAFEIGIVVQKLLKKNKFDAIMTLGMVIKGKTRHFKHVVDAASQGTWQAALEYDIPVIHGVIAAENIEQAIDRTGGKLGHKGRDAAKAAIEMSNLMRSLKP